ncbi:hypothetical protein E4U43_004045, partial [Claviceps pusilla]
FRLQMVLLQPDCNFRTLPINMIITAAHHCQDYTFHWPESRCYNSRISVNPSPVA